MQSRIELLVFASLSLGLLAGPLLADQIQDFLLKGGRGHAENLLESVQLSRGPLFERMVDNMQKHPGTGIGFGIASGSDPNGGDARPVFNFPVRADIEKGIMPLAVVEELGVPGAFLVAIWFFILLRSAARGGLVALSVAATVVFLNLGG